MRPLGSPGALAVLVTLVLSMSACASPSTPGNSPGGSGRTSPTGAAATSADAGPTSPAVGVGDDAGCPASNARDVSSADDLRAALAAAVPGETIVLAPGTYEGNFVATASGRQGALITLCGGRNAIIAAPGIEHGYALHLDGASWWRLIGFSVQGGQKGIVADGVTHDLLYGLYVHDIGDEGIHLRAFSSYNTVSHCIIRRTGLYKTFYGEGIYVGSAHKNWCRYTHCQPDQSNYNQIIDNNIADTTAENIDIKEGTTGGLIKGNYLDGAGMVASAATSWINVKGNHWTVEDNIGIDSIGNGFSVHQVYPGWGLDNVFLNNHARVNGPGYGIYVQSHHLGTVVSCDNVAEGAAGGMSNIPCAGP
jgi:Right handed beta helix region